MSGGHALSGVRGGYGAHGLACGWAGSAARLGAARHAVVLAFLADGESWSSSALALALGATAHRAASARLACGSRQGQSFGRWRARRWMTPPVPGFTTTLLLLLICRLTKMDTCVDQPPRSSVSMAPFRVSTRCMASRLTVSRSGLLETRSTPSILRAGRCCAIDVAAHAERPLTASTCFSSPRIASGRSIRRPAGCSPRSRRPAAAVTRGSRGPKGRSGWASIGTGRSIKSIPKPGRFFARSSPTASSPGSPGSTESSGTAPGKVTRAICGETILERERFWSGSRSRREWAFPGSSPMAAIQFFCGAEGAGR